MADRDEPCYPSMIKEQFKVFYFKTIDVDHDALKGGFDQVLYIFIRYNNSY